MIIAYDMTIDKIRLEKIRKEITNYIVMSKTSNGKNYRGIEKPFKMEQTIQHVLTIIFHTERSSLLVLCSLSCKPETSFQSNTIIK